MIGEESADGSGALVFSSITATGEAEDIQDPISQTRDLVSTDNYDEQGELQVAVTGPAGYSADAIEVFESINGILFAAAFGLVFILLILIYRSPVLLWIPLLAVGFAEIATRALGFGLTEAGVAVFGQSSAILSILVLGAGTDYALPLIARYREELRRQPNRAESMKVALHRRPGDPRPLRDRDRGPALPQPCGPELNGEPWADRGDRDRPRDPFDAHLRAGAACNRAPRRFLAAGAQGWRRGRRRNPWRLAQARRSDRTATPPCLGRIAGPAARGCRRGAQLRPRPHLLERLPR